MSAKPVTREEFAALVADLRAELVEVDEQRRTQYFAVPRHTAPAAWRGYPWVRRYAGADALVDLTGLARRSIVVYDQQARKARAGGETVRRLMPASRIVNGHREWMLGEVALWIATRNDAQATSTGRPQDYDELVAKVKGIYERDGMVTAAGIDRELGLNPANRMGARLIREAGLVSASPNVHSATDAEVLGAARGAVKQHGLSAGLTDVAAVLSKIRMRANVKRIRPFLAQARIERLRAAMKPTDSTEGAELEGMYPGGLVDSIQIARIYGITAGAVTKARRLGNIKVAGWERERPLYDPARLWVRADGGSGPVDKNSLLAAKIDLD